MSNEFLDRAATHETERVIENALSKLGDECPLGARVELARKWAPTLRNLDHTVANEVLNSRLGSPETREVINRHKNGGVQPTAPPPQRGTLEESIQHLEAGGAPRDNNDSLALAFLRRSQQGQGTFGLTPINRK